MTVQTTERNIGLGGEIKTINMKAKQLIAKYFIRNGCIRNPDKERLKEGYKKYKKGSEARFTAMNEKETAIIISALNTLGIGPGKPFKKVSRIIIPVYSITKVSEILEITRQYKKTETK